MSDILQVDWRCGTVQDLRTVLTAPREEVPA
jgi:hypothetical protein